MAAVAEVRKRTADYAALLWKAQSGFRDDDVATFTRRMVPAVQSAQVRTAALTSSYIARTTGEKPVPVVRADVVGGRGIDPVEVYTRPAVTVRTQLSQGASYADAVGAGLVRLQSIAAMDLQMSKVRQSRASLQRSSYQFYARVLTGNENCALCTIASTQRYRRGNLMPIHPGCDCGIEPLPRGAFPNQVIDQDLLDRTHEQIAAKLGSSDRGARNLGIGKATAIDDKPISDFTELIIARDHGDMGPVLTWRADRFTGPANL
jgi:hypothetical protein